MSDDAPSVGTVALVAVAVLLVAAPLAGVAAAGLAGGDDGGAVGDDGDAASDGVAAAAALQPASETVVHRGENATIVRSGVFSIVDATDRAYSEMDGEPVVANGQVYGVFTGNKLAGDEGEQRFFSALYALDAETLDAEWRVEFETAGLHGRPVVADGTAYVVMYEQNNGTGPDTYYLHAFDADSGDRLWKHELGSIPYEERGKASGTHGRYHPIYVVDGRVHTLTVDAGLQTLVALDPASGDVAWRQDGIAAGVGTDGERIYAGYREGRDEFDAGAVLALDPATGETVWTRPNGDLYGQQRVSLVENGRVYATRPAPLDSDAVANVHAIDAATGEVAWTETASGNSRIAITAVYPASETVVGETWSPIDETDEPKVQGFDDATGDTRWAVSDRRLGPTWTVYAGERNLYVYSAGGFSAYPGDTLHGPDTDGFFPQAAWSQAYGDFDDVREIAESDGSLYELRTTTTRVAVSAFDASEGDRRYEFDVEGLRPYMTVANDTVYLETAGLIRAYEAVDPGTVPTDASPSQSTGDGDPAGDTDARERVDSGTAAGDSSTAPALPGPLAGRGPLGAPLAVFAGLGLGLATSGLLVGRRYRF
ncbi:PQQ-binding-like beta-propeller repeat protein [Halosimplex litoreum]|uniref:PQQ-binding-like beta-propeller repeat protein n=1 Tax=Halosimplex litoreum TaxID=1198301 RepID=A0A7U3WAN8_9EURY|nr:PQQ-binding-like beta-propeller repeat protein [Halosimplex litoreum]QPV64683.1 PQQ-binding-like beta-propeller repeat protein [Halosimplex litoreum]